MFGYVPVLDRDGIHWQRRLRQAGALLLLWIVLGISGNVVARPVLADGASSSSSPQIAGIQNVYVVGDEGVPRGVWLNPGWLNAQIGALQDPGVAKCKDRKYNETKGGENECRCCNKEPFRKISKATSIDVYQAFVAMFAVGACVLGIFGFWFVGRHPIVGCLFLLVGFSVFIYSGLAALHGPVAEQFAR